MSAPVRFMVAVAAGLAALAAVTPVRVVVADRIAESIDARPGATQSTSGAANSLVTWAGGTSVGASATTATQQGLQGLADVVFRVFRPPVDADVFDPFRPPPNPYGPGNRGIEYDTLPGQLVLAAASGTVSFAGQVASELHVTVDHGNGLLSSYSYLASINVQRGEHVKQSQVVGTTGSKRLHFGVRLDGEYVDPADFFGVPRVVVRLVPHWT